MTEVILQRLEEKVLHVLAEMEKMRHDLQNLQQENLTLKSEKERNTNKLQGLISLFESMGSSVERSMPAGNVAVFDAALLQG